MISFVLKVNITSSVYFIIEKLSHSLSLAFSIIFTCFLVAEVSKISFKDYFQTFEYLSHPRGLIC